MLVDIILFHLRRGGIDLTLLQRISCLVQSWGHTWLLVVLHKVLTVRCVSLFLNMATIWLLVLRVALSLQDSVYSLDKIGGLAYRRVVVHGLVRNRIHFLRKVLSALLLVRVVFVLSDWNTYFGSDIALILLWLLIYATIFLICLLRANDLLDLLLPIVVAKKCDRVWNTIVFEIAELVVVNH